MQQKNLNHYHRGLTNNKAGLNVPSTVLQNNVMMVVSHFIYMVPVNESVDNHAQKHLLV